MEKYTLPQSKKKNKKNSGHNAVLKDGTEWFNIKNTICDNENYEDATFKTEKYCKIFFYCNFFLLTFNYIF